MVTLNNVLDINKGCNHRLKKFVLTIMSYDYIGIRGLEFGRFININQCFLVGLSGNNVLSYANFET